MQGQEFVTKEARASLDAKRLKMQAVPHALLDQKNRFNASASLLGR
jgi:hypothetical protein